MMDTGLHFKGNSRAWALKMFEDYAWDTSDVAVKEVTRYQSIPGQAVTYMLGQLVIMRLNDQANSTLKDKYNIKDFHYQVFYYLKTFSVKQSDHLLYISVLSTSPVHHILIYLVPAVFP